MSVEAAVIRHQFDIRPPKDSDFEPMIEMFVWIRDQDSCNYSGITLSIPALARIFTEMIFGSRYFSRVAEAEDGRAAGFFIGEIQSFYFSEETFGQDRIIMFHPDYRRGCSSALRRMFSEFEDWSKERGATAVVMGASTGTDGAGLLKAFEDSGYGRLGYSVMKKLK